MTTTWVMGVCVKCHRHGFCTRTAPTTCITCTDTRQLHSRQTNFNDTGVHVRLKFNGAAPAIDVCKSMIFDLDSDFPYNPLIKSSDTVRGCKSCGGLFWRKPVLTPEHLHKAAAQCKVNLKVKQWASKCCGDLQSLTAVQAKLI